jgi:Fic family protein
MAYYAIVRMKRSSYHPIELIIRELHQLAVSGLTDEGGKTPGAYRNWNAQISKSTHLPPRTPPSAKLHGCAFGFYQWS